MDANLRPTPTCTLNQLGIGLDALADSLPGGLLVCETEGNGRILYANEPAARLFGCEDVAEFLEFVGGTFGGTIRHTDRSRMLGALHACRAEDDGHGSSQSTRLACRIKQKDGPARPVEEHVRLVSNAVAGDLVFVFVVDASPATSPTAGQDRAKTPYNANVDMLTSMHSMRYYQRNIAGVLARAAAEGIPMANVYFDVDHFRTINYRLGYDGGDQILQRIGRILQEGFPGDLLARFSDDHFVLVTRRADLEERIARVHDRVDQLLLDTSVEIKAGIYEFTSNEADIPFAHDRAKVACASIKGRYDRFYRFYDSSLASSEDRRDYIVNHIEQAVAEGWIHNYYQPVVRVSSRSCCGLEALSRWFDPDAGILPPARYVQVLEEARLVHLLDQAVLDRACNDLKHMIKHTGAAVPTSLNFSPSTLSCIDVPTLVDQTVRKYNIPRNLVRIEITESALTDDPELLHDVIRRLHELGFEAWMDDFGSGYSSLNLLKDYDFDLLKIDMEFLRGMERNKKSRTIVRSITDLAHRLKMITLVEGVETEGQLDFLSLVGADRAQGFLFSEPVPYEAIIGDFFLRYPPERKAMEG